MSKKRISTTVDSSLMGMVDSILTPSGFMSPPKGSYSVFIENMLTQYLEDFYGTDIISILGAASSVGNEEKAIRQELAAKAV